MKAFSIVELLTIEINNGKLKKLNLLATNKEVHFVD